MRVVGVAEPDQIRRDRFLSQYDVPSDMVFRDSESLLAWGERQAITIINCTMDRVHFDSTMQMLEAGYDVFLEIPMTPVLEESVHLVRKAEGA